MCEQHAKFLLHGIGMDGSLGLFDYESDGFPNHYITIRHLILIPIANPWLHDSQKASFLYLILSALLAVS